VTEPTARVAGITPDPTEEEVAAIAAAVEAAWPRSVVVVATPPSRPAAWRFSGRWWARPIAARRDRPWH
jgi:hypothetical protein